MGKHAFVHIEIPALDPVGAGKFYSDLFGWQVSNDPQLDYVSFDPGQGPGGGFPRADGELCKVGDLLVYVHTDDIDATLAKIEGLGGKTLMPKSEIPGIGWYAFFADPSGNHVGLYTPVSGQS